MQYEFHQGHPASAAARNNKIVYCQGAVDVCESANGGPGGFGLGTPASPISHGNGV